jgi:hypothetical protein
VAAWCRWNGVLAVGKCCSEEGQALVLVGFDLDQVDQVGRVVWGWRGWARAQVRDDSRGEDE